MKPELVFVLYCPQCELAELHVSVELMLDLLSLTCTSKLLSEIFGNQFESSLNLTTVN